MACSPQPGAHGQVSVSSSDLSPELRTCLDNQLLLCSGLRSHNSGCPSGAQDRPARRPPSRHRPSQRPEAAGPCCPPRGTPASPSNGSQVRPLRWLHLVRAHTSRSSATQARLDPENQSPPTLPTRRTANDLFRAHHRELGPGPLTMWGDPPGSPAAGRGQAVREDRSDSAATGASGTPLSSRRTQVSLTLTRTHTHTHGRACTLPHLHPSGKLLSLVSVGRGWTHVPAGRATPPCPTALPVAIGYMAGRVTGLDLAVCSAPPPQPGERERELRDSESEEGGEQRGADPAASAACALRSKPACAPGQARGVRGPRPAMTRCSAPRLDRFSDAAP